MDDQNKRKLSINDQIIEDLPTLYQRRYKKIKEKNEISKFSDISRLKSSDNLKMKTNWDIILSQVKRLALYYHEDRKWKLCTTHILTGLASQKVQKERAKEKIDIIHKRLFGLYLALQVNFNLKEISNGNHNNKMNSNLEALIKKIAMNPEEFRREIQKKKESISMIKVKLDNMFGDRIKGAENLMKIIRQIENLISSSSNLPDYQNTNNQLSNIPNIDMMLDVPNQSKFIIDHEIERINKIYENVDDHGKVDLSNINKEITDLLKDLNEMSIGSNYTENVFPCEENVINDGELKLYYMIPISKNEGELLKNALVDKFPKITMNIIPDFNIDRKKSPYEIIENDDFEENFDKIFSSVLSLSERQDAMIVDDVVVKRKDTKTQLASNSDNIQTIRFNVKQENKVTAMQKSVYLWGLSMYGFNINILQDIINIFPFSKSLCFEKDDELVQFFHDMLKEFDVDLEISSFENLNYPVDSNLASCFLEPPILNCLDSSFMYSQKIYDAIYTKNKSKLENWIGENSSRPFKQFNINFVDRMKVPRLNFITNNKIVKDLKDKEKLKKQIIDQQIEICNVVVQNYKNHSLIKENTPKSQNNNKNNSTINNQIDLMTNKVENLIDNIAMKALDKNKPIKNNMMEGIAFYSQATIQREWDILRNPWYQNNFQCKPKFRKYTKVGQLVIPGGYYAGGNQMMRNINDSRNI